LALVPLLVVRADARGVDRRLELGATWVVGMDLAACDDLVEMTAHGHHAQVLGRKLDLGVKRIELPGSHVSLLGCCAGIGYTSHRRCRNGLGSPFISASMG